MKLVTTIAFVWYQAVCVQLLVPVSVQKYVELLPEFMLAQWKYEGGAHH